VQHAERRQAQQEQLDADRGRARNKTNVSARLRLSIPTIMARRGGTVTIATRGIPAATAVYDRPRVAVV